MADEERLLFKELIRGVDMKFGVGLFRYDWNFENFDTFVADCFQSGAKVNIQLVLHFLPSFLQLMAFVENYKAAVSEMLSLCETLADTKMVVIPSGNIFDLVALEEHIDECRTQAFLRIVEIYEDFLKHLFVIWEGFEEVLSEVITTFTMQNL